MGPSSDSTPTSRGTPSALLLEQSRGSLARGTALGRYVVLEPLGSGGMGTVYAAYDPQLDRKIALKLLHPESAAGDQTRLLREAQALARLRHPNVISVHDVGTVDGRVFVAMQLAEGGALRSWLRARQRSWREVLRMFIPAGRGLAAAHEAGLIHRDFKPENVLLDREGRVRVSDFGVARMSTEPAPTEPIDSRSSIDGPQTTAGTLLGTLQYMAPEQLSLEGVSARADQFSFCVALYEALHGVVRGKNDP